MTIFVRTLAWATAILTLACVTGCSTHNSRAQEAPRLLLHAQVDVLNDKILLEELRAGRLTNAIELIEQDLDVQVLLINRFRSSAGPLEAQKASSTLRAVEEYRSMNPRKREAWIEGMEDVDPSFEQTQERVRQILHDAKTIGVQQEGGANGSPPSRSGTNSTSSAAGCRRSP